MNRVVILRYSLSVWFYEQYFIPDKILPLNSNSFMQYAGWQVYRQEL